MFGIGLSLCIPRVLRATGSLSDFPVPGPDLKISQISYPGCWSGRESGTAGHTQSLGSLTQFVSGIISGIHGNNLFWDYGDLCVTLFLSAAHQLVMCAPFA